MNNRQKGAAGERELARILREYGYNTRRGQQYSGANGDADVVGLPGIHIECKRVERLNISDAMTQSIKDAKPGEMPTVFHRKNCEPWKTTMLTSDWLKLYGNQKPEWIWCRDRLPEDGDIKDPEDAKIYLVMIEGAKAPTTLRYAGDGQWFGWSGDMVWYSVVAWMPLPAPPEEEP